MSFPIGHGQCNARAPGARSWLTCSLQFCLDSKSGEKGGQSRFSPDSWAQFAHQRHARIDVEFAEDLADLRLDGIRADAAQVGNLRKRAAFTKLPGHRLLGDS